MNISTYIYAPLLALAFAALFVAIWCGVCLLLSRVSGWDRLSQIYPGAAPPAGKRFAPMGVLMGLARYKGCVVCITGPEGLHLSVLRIFQLGHPPLLIPWSAITVTRLRKVAWKEAVEFQIASPNPVIVTMEKAVLEGWKPLPELR